jgi:hypothetical protein
MSDQPTDNQTEPNAKPPADGAADPPAPSGQTMLDKIRSWTMVGLTALFVVLYVFALLGSFPEASDNFALQKLEPILFAIVAYYFGRVPGQKAEAALDGEQKQRKQAETQATEQQVEAEKAKEKIRNAKAALASSVPEPVGAEGSFAAALTTGTKGVDERSVRHAAAAAMSILE